MASVAAPLLDFLSALPRIALHRYYADRSTCQALLRALPPLARLCARALCSRHAVLGIFAAPLAALAMMHHDGGFVREYGMLQGFDATVWVIVVLNSLGGLLVAASMKYADNIAKCFATAIAIVSGTVFSVPLFHFTLTPIFGVGAICTILASVLYSMAPEGLFPSCSRANAAVAAVILVVPGVAGAASQTSHAGQVVVPVTSMSGAGRVAQISRVDILPRAQTPTMNVTGPLCGTDMTGGCEQMSQICHTCSTRMLGRHCDSTALLTEQELPSVPRIYSFECITASSAKPPLVNFFSCAHGYKYERFLPLYAFFALHYNQHAVAELVVPNRTTFLKLHSTPLSLLQDLYGHKAVCVREYRRSLPRRVVANTRRYLEVPALAAKYTYIGDIDILITERVVSPKRLQQMLHFDLPYSNVVRPTPPEGLKRLTGVMLVKTAQFYTPALRKAQLEVNPEGNDENFLARLVEASHLGLPPLPSLNRTTNQWTTYRPVHGLHLSLRRGWNASARGRAIGISVHPGEWCKVLRTPVLHRYLCTDSAGRIILRSFAEFAFCSSENGAGRISHKAAGRSWSLN